MEGARALGIDGRQEGAPVGRPFFMVVTQSDPVVLLGSSVADAQAYAYAGVSKISWANEFHRSDIGWRAIAREQQA